MLVDLSIDGLECEYEPSTGPVAKAAARIHAPAPAYTAPPVAPISATHTDALVSTRLAFSSLTARPHESFLTKYFQSSRDSGQITVH